MSFRLNVIPLNKRTEQLARDNELIVDTVHGNIGVATTNGVETDKIYNSGTEKIKTDLESLKIRNKLMTDNLAKIAFGSENNVSDKDFEITTALENKDILGSLQYILNQYSIFVKGLDEDGNVVLDSGAFEYDENLNSLIKKLYDIDGEYSYSYKFRAILSEVFKNSAQQEENNAEVENIDVNEFSYRKLQKLLKDYIPLLYNLESKITLIEQMIQTINEDINVNIPNSIDELEKDLDLLKYRTKSAKFEKENIQFTNDNIEFYQTETDRIDNKIQFAMPAESNLEEDKSKTFNDYFVSSILDDNYDGNLNNYQSDSVDSDIKLLNDSYIIDQQRQRYFAFPKLNKYNNIKLIYDGVEHKPLFKYMNFDNEFDKDNLIYYFNYNNYILEYIMSSQESTNPTFVLKNIDHIGSTTPNKNFIYLFHKNDDTLNNQNFYLPSLYSLKNTVDSFNFKTDFNFNFFVGIVIIQNILAYKIDEESEDTQPTKISKAYTLLRNSLASFEDDTNQSGVITTTQNSLSGKSSVRFEKNNNREFLGNIYYSGYNGSNDINSFVGYDTVINDINTYGNHLFKTGGVDSNGYLNEIASSINLISYPKISDTDFYIDNGSYEDTTTNPSTKTDYIILASINNQSEFSYKPYLNNNAVSTSIPPIYPIDIYSYNLTIPNIDTNFSLQHCLKQITNNDADVTVSSTSTFEF